MTKNFGLVFIIASMFICTSCDQILHKVTEMTAKPTKPVIPPPLKPGQVLDPSSDYAKYWTGLPEWVQFDDIMTLKIPAQFKQFWNLKNYPQMKFTHATSRPKNIRQIEYLAFSMYMPNFEGYTPDNYKNEFDKNEVKIVTIEAAPMTKAEPDAPGNYPTNKWGQTRLFCYT